MRDNHEVPSTMIASPGHPEADRLGTNDIHDSAIETGSPENVSSSVTVDESDPTDLDGNNLAKFLGRGETGLQFQPAWLHVLTCL